MKHPIERAGYILCLFLILLIVLSGFLKLDKPVPASLHVPFIAQTGRTWCWAACTEMVSRYYHDKIDPTAPIITQCDIVKASYGGSCNMPCPPPDTLPPECDNSGNWPFTPPLGWSYSFTEGVAPKAALTWEELQREIRDNRMPVTFQWKWKGITRSTRGYNDAHWLVAEGCPSSSYDTTRGWVSIHDPLPVGRGRHRIISYPEYANEKLVSFPGGRRYDKYVFNDHGQDYYGFKYTGGRK